MTKQSLTQRVLTIIMEKMEEGGRNFVDITDAMSRYPHTFNSMRIEELRERRAYAEQKRLRRALQDLQRQKLLAARKIGDRLLWGLTDAGRLRTLHLRIRTTPPCPSNECVMVIFDIPETQRRIRDVFRRFLHECGFSLLQQSVWISHRAVLEHLRTFVRMNEIERWVQVFIARDVSLLKQQNKKTSFSTAVEKDVFAIS